jgi:hypothetical protein
LVIIDSIKLKGKTHVSKFIATNFLIIVTRKQNQIYASSPKL